MAASMLYVHALTPIHVGIGQGAGVIDLPVIRETVTGWPYLPGSSVKGVLRDACEAKVDADTIKTVFGPKATGDPSEHAGGLIFTDLRLLCLPVRTYAGSFAWVTSPLVLRRWARDYELVDSEIAKKLAGAVPATVTDGAIVLPSDAAKQAIQTGSLVRLEDLELTHEVVASIAPIAATISAACFPGADAGWRDFFTTHLGIVADTTFSFLTRTATEVTARNRIDPERKIVQTGALWYEESVPAESIFAGPLIPTAQGIARLGDIEGGLAGAVAKGTERPVQIGGNASVGRGLALAHLAGGGA